MKKLVFDRDRVTGWVGSRIGATSWAGHQAIGLENENGDLIAGVVFDSYRPGGSCSMHCAGDGKVWLNKEFLFVCFDYAFRQLGCNVIVNTVDAANEASLRFTRHIGFQECCRIPGGCGNSSLVILSLQRTECRWLMIGVKYGKEFVSAKS